MLKLKMYNTKGKVRQNEEKAVGRVSEELRKRIRREKLASWLEGAGMSSSSLISTLSYHLLEVDVARADFLQRHPHSEFCAL